MRLLNTTTLLFEEFFDDFRRQTYAILSHCWTDDEISYKDFVKGRRRESAGYQKVVAFCNFARAWRYKWVWIDTCCIDKRSSAELSEAINSMYAWYRNAETCYAYLADVFSGGNQMDEFRQSRWFTRGWTLQEMLAPDSVVFCDASWNVFGNKDLLSVAIEQITGINQYYLENRFRVREPNIATKMSWISKRCTTRTEDVAYCMLGLFGVNKPLLYGEGNKAFLRLQTEIIRTSNDQSIFAWRKGVEMFGDHSTMLAPAPSFFNIGTVSGRGDPEFTYSMVQRGMELPVPHRVWMRQPVDRLEEDQSPVFGELFLDCIAVHHGVHYIPCILLEWKGRQAKGRHTYIWARHSLFLRPASDAPVQRPLLTDPKCTTILVENSEFWTEA